MNMFVVLASTVASINLGGEWMVEGEGFAGEANLPGTLAEAHLGKRWTEHDFQTTMDLPQSEALVQEWQYVGKATWTRSVELSAADCDRAAVTRDARPYRAIRSLRRMSIRCRRGGLRRGDMS